MEDKKLVRLSSGLCDLRSPPLTTPSLDQSLLTGSGRDEKSTL